MLTVQPCCNCDHSLFPLNNVSFQYLNTFHMCPLCLSCPIWIKHTCFSSSWFELVVRLNYPLPSEHTLMKTKTTKPWSFRIVALSHYFETMRLFPFFSLQLKLQSHWTTKLQYLQEESHLQDDEFTGHMGFIASTFIGVICWQMPKKEYRVIKNNKTWWRSLPHMLSGEKLSQIPYTKVGFLDLSH